MANSILIEESKPSNLKRLKFLPRVAVTVDFAGKKLTYRNAPLIEALLNAYDSGGINLKNLLDVSREQLKEILRVSEDGAEMREEKQSAEEIEFSVVSSEVESAINLAEKEAEMEDDWKAIEKPSDINLSEKVSNLSQEARDLF